jgi:hypothetical protein
MRWKMAKEALDVGNDEEWSFWDGKLFVLRSIRRRLFDVHDFGVGMGVAWGWNLKIVYFCGW